MTTQQIRRTQEHQMIMINPLSKGPKGKSRLFQLNPYLPLDQKVACTCQIRVILYTLLCAILVNLVSKVTASSYNSKSRYLRHHSSLRMIAQVYPGSKVYPFKKMFCSRKFPYPHQGGLLEIIRSKEREKGV